MFDYRLRRLMFLLKASRAYTQTNTSLSYEYDFDPLSDRRLSFGFDYNISHRRTGGVSSTAVAGVMG